MIDPEQQDAPIQVVPQLRVADLKRSIAFYADALGLSATVLDPPEAPVFASLEAGDVTLFLVADDESLAAEALAAPRGAGVRIYFEVEDAERLYRRLVDAGVEVLGPPVRNEEEDYVEFRMVDPDGYEIGVYS